MPPFDAETSPVRVPPTLTEPPVASSPPLVVASPLTVREALDCTVKELPEVATSSAPVENVPARVVSPPMVNSAELPVPVITWGI